MLQRFFFSCFTITNDHKDYVKASLIKNIACMFHVTVEQLKQMTNWKMVSVGKMIEDKIVKVYYGIKHNEEEVEEEEEEEVEEEQEEEI